MKEGADMRRGRAEMMGPVRYVGEEERAREIRASGRGSEEQQQQHTSEAAAAAAAGRVGRAAKLDKQDRRDEERMTRDVS